MTSDAAGGYDWELVDRWRCEGFMWYEIAHALTKDARSPVSISSLRGQYSRWRKREVAVPLSQTWLDGGYGSNPRTVTILIEGPKGDEDE